MKKFITFLRWLFKKIKDFKDSLKNQQAEFHLDDLKEVSVYLEREDYLTLDDDTQLPEPTKKEILKRYKSIYGKGVYRKRVFCTVVKSKVATLKELKEKYVRFKNNEVVLIELSGRTFKLNFKPIHEMPVIKNFGHASRYMPEQWNE